MGQDLQEQAPRDDQLPNDSVALTGALQQFYGRRVEIENIANSWDGSTEVENPVEYLLAEHRRQTTVLRVMQTVEAATSLLDGLDKEDPEAANMARAAGWSLSTGAAGRSEELFTSQVKTISLIRALLQRTDPTVELPELSATEQSKAVDVTWSSTTEPRAHDLLSMAEKPTRNFQLSLYSKAFEPKSLDDRAVIKIPASEASRKLARDPEKTKDSRPMDQEAWVNELLEYSIYTVEARNIKVDGQLTAEAEAARIEDREIHYNAEQLTELFGKRQINATEIRDGIIGTMLLRRYEKYCEAIKLVVNNNGTELRHGMAVFIPYQHVVYNAYRAGQSLKEDQILANLESALGDIELPPYLKGVGVDTYIEVFNKAIDEKVERVQERQWSERKARIIGQIENTTHHEAPAIEERLADIFKPKGSEGTKT